MKKILIATTALVAFAGAANAAEPIKLTVGGFAEQWVGYVDNDLPLGAERNKFDVQGDTELLIKGSTKLDNGITVGVTVEVEAGQNQVGAGAPNGSNSSIDESYITVSGGFGSLIVGQQDNVGQIIHNASPDVGIGLQDGDADRWFDVTGAAFSDLTFATGADSDADKVIYVTPAFAGLQFGASYTPDITGANQGDQVLQSSADLSSLWVAGFAYNNKFGDVTVKADIGTGVANREGGLAAIKAHQAGLNVGYAGFTVGGGIALNDGENDSTDTTTWDLGVAYATGPYAVSLSYLQHDNETGNNDGTSNVWMLSGAYTMGPGVAAKASLLRGDFEDVNGDDANEGWGFVTGLRLDF